MLRCYCYVFAMASSEQSRVQVCMRACLPTDRLNSYEPIMFRQTKILTKDTLYAKNNLT